MNTFAEQAPLVQSLIGLILLVGAALSVNYLLKSVILRIAEPYLDRKTKTIDKSVAWLATAAPQALIVISVAMAIVKALTYANELYERLPRSKNRPIKGFVQVVKIIVLCGAAIIMISVLIDQSPLLLLSGLDRDAEYERRR